jgi:hypothetical protein
MFKRSNRPYLQGGIMTSKSEIVGAAWKCYTGDSWGGPKRTPSPKERVMDAIMDVLREGPVPSWRVEILTGISAKECKTSLKELDRLGMVRNAGGLWGVV